MIAGYLSGDTAHIQTVPCIICGRTTSMALPSAQVAAYLGGALAQHAFPDMSPEDRELIISGTHPECWGDL